MTVGRVVMDGKRGRWLRRLAVGTSVVAALLMWLAYLGHRASDDTKPGPQAEGMSSWMSASVGTQAANAPVPTFKTGLEALPSSLAGTEVAGDLREDEQGKLILDKGVREVFDYFLSSRGEQPDAVLDARMRAYVKHRLHMPAAQQALALLDSYLAYLQQLDVVSQKSRNGASMAPKERLALLVDLRSRSFTADVVQAFFALDQAYDQYTVDKITVFNDRSLSPIQKANQIKALRQALPQDLQASLDATEVAPTLQAVTQEWRERGGSVADLRTLRETLVGKEAADRLEDLDRDEQAWQVRMQAYLQARALILADVSLAEAVKHERVQRLMSSSFSASEQLRVPSFERMSDQKLAMNPS